MRLGVPLALWGWVMRFMFGILLIVVAASLTGLAGCAPLRLQLAWPADDAGASRNAGGVRPGDTNVTNLVADGDVAVGGDLTVAGECVGCGGGTTIETLNDIPTLSASRPMTVTNLTVSGTCTGCGAATRPNYRVYVALLGGQDYSTDPPVATVLENTLGGPVAVDRLLMTVMSGRRWPAASIRQDCDLLPFLCCGNHVGAV